MTQVDHENWPRRVVIVGVGLLGGSVAHSIRRLRPDTQFIGVARNDQKCRTLEELGVVSSATTSLEQACRQCDVVVIGLPVDRIAEVAIEAAGCTPDDCLITDVGSTKRQIVEAVAGNRVAAEKFVAAHPIAGSEKTGAIHATPTLFDGKKVVLTPSDANSGERVDRADQFWRLTGAQTVTLDPATHDTHLATISHVPHLASALIARLADGESRSLVGSGWRDVTRVAAGDPGMWTAICQENREAIVRELARLDQDFQQLRRLLETADDQSLHDWLAEAKQIKDRS